MEIDQNPLDFNKRKILITGASSGIGKSTARYLSQLGATIVLVDINESGLTKTLTELKPGNHKKYVVDLISNTDLSDIFEFALLDGIKLSGLIHCAGIAQVLPLNMLTRERILKEMTLNYFVFIELVRQFAKTKYSNGGSIIGISSIASEQVEKCQTNYAASKAAMDIAARALSFELASKNIRINTILPGATNTPLINKVNGRDIDSIIASQVLGLVQPSDIAEACAFLQSDLSRMITGRRLFVDGGKY